VLAEFWLPEEGLEALHDLAPDLVIVSAQMKLLAWQEFARLVTSVRPTTKVLVLTDGRAGDRWPDPGQSRIQLTSRRALDARELRRMCRDGAQR
jgi:hypothetical protein